jgi:diketogulonate reductase-like aldo/keto reductase
MEYVSVHGVTVPAIGFGTARMTGEPCERAVRHALELGYRHVDTAQMYDNESAVGRAIAAADVDREAVFVTTKLDRGNRAHDDVVSTTNASLDRLGLDAVDLLLVHSPNVRVPVEETVGAMNELQREGLVHHVGVSNFSVGGLRDAIEASEAPIVTNQVEYHPYRHQDDLLAFCSEAGVVLTAYSPLDVGRAASDRTLADIGERHGKTAAQVALRWLVQQPSVVTIPKAASEAHLAENLDVFDFELTDEEMERVFDLGSGLADRVRRLLR